MADLEKLLRRCPKSLDRINTPHVIITGSEGSGKSALLKALIGDIPVDGLRTRKIEDGQKCPVSVVIEDYNGGEAVQIAKRNADGTGIDLIEEGFVGQGCRLIEAAMATDNPWAVIDAIGFIETDVKEYCAMVHKLFNTKRVAAVLTKRNNRLRNELLTREDILLIDADE